MENGLNRYVTNISEEQMKCEATTHSWLKPYEVNYWLIGKYHAIEKWLNVYQLLLGLSN